MTPRAAGAPSAPTRAARRATLLSLVALSCSGAVSRGRAPTSAAPPSYRVVDVMPRFFAFWDHDVPAAHGDTTALVRLFRERVVRPDSALFARAVGGPSDASIRRFVGRVGPTVPAMRVVSARLERDLGRFTRALADSFPDFDFHGSVYLIPSMGVRDGGVIDFPPSLALIFGVDVIARRDGPDADLGVLFTHELFHVYHLQQHPEWHRGPSPLSRRVWVEGLATYVSRRLNPASSERAVLLGDERLATAGPRLPTLAAALLGKLDDTSSATARPYLQGGTDDPNVPPRAAYLIGLRVAEVMGRTRSVRQLAALDDATVRREMAGALHAFAARSDAGRHPLPTPPPPAGRSTVRPGTAANARYRSTAPKRSISAAARDSMARSSGARASR